MDIYRYQPFIIFSAFVLLLLFIMMWKNKITKQQLMLEQKKKNEFELKYQNQQIYADTIFGQAKIGIALLHLDGSFYNVNNALCEFLSYQPADLLKTNFFDLIKPNDINNIEESIQQLLKRETQFHQSEQLFYKKEGQTIWALLSLYILYDIQHQAKYFVVQIQNISLQKNAEARLKHMAYHDPLTSLANRNRLEQFIGHLLASARRHEQMFALLFLDLDRFKNVNDTIGHESGDLLLQIIAERLRNAVRNTDMVARLGGDEFVILLVDVKRMENIAAVAQKILNETLQVITIKGQEIYITTSIGISIYPYNGLSMQTLMKNADLALYRAKEHGRNNYEFYNTEMTNQAQEKLALQNALGHALAKKEFFLHFQPKMIIDTKRISGVEALLRWKNKEYSTVTPDEIVMLAEEMGLIVQVSEWILHESCKQLKIWHDAGMTSLTIAVNCSSRQIKQTTFVNHLLHILSSFNLPAHLIEIEVTESTLMQDPETILHALYALKDLGVQIVIDHFGTGYWSLNNLKRLAVNKIKIDKSIINQLTIDETSATITKAIIAMLNKLNIVSVATGVETAEQFEFLRKEGCVEIQGYFLSHPLNDEEMSKFLRHQKADVEIMT